MKSKRKPSQAVTEAAEFIEKAKAFKRLLAARGVVRGKGGDRGNQHEAKATVALCRHSSRAWRRG